MSEIEPKTLTLKEGSDGIFKCHSESPVHWFHVQENYPFNPEEKSLNDYSEYSNIQKNPLPPNVLVSKYNEIKINSVNFKNRGYYLCKGTDENNEFNYFSRLKIIGMVLIGALVHQV